MKIKKLVVVSVGSIALVAAALVARVTDGGEADADTPKIRINPAVLGDDCPATIKFKLQVDPVDVGGFSGERLNVDSATAHYEKVFVNGGNQVRCHYTTDLANAIFQPSLIRVFPGKTCTASADHKTFSCK